MTLLRWLTSLLRSLTVTPTVLLFCCFFLFWSYYLFYNSLPSIVKFWLYCCLSFYWLSIKLKMWCPVSLHSLWLFLAVFVTFLGCSIGISLNWMLLLLLVNFVSGSRLQLMFEYIPHRKNQVKPHSFPWFSAACAVAIVHKNHFFRLYLQN